MKKALCLLYVVVMVVMAVATIVEKYQGTDHVARYWYGSWWFAALWALLTATGVAWFLRQRVRRPSAVVLHLAFVVILAGALLTRTTAYKGMIHLRVGQPVDTYTPTDPAPDPAAPAASSSAPAASSSSPAASSSSPSAAGSHHSQRVSAGPASRPLPFRITLTSFQVLFHEGTQAPADYRSRFVITDGGGTTEGEVSMNHIFSHRQLRLYQSSYDPDGQGSYLALNSDPWGIPVTYLGYALLFVGLVWVLLDPKGQYRRLLRSEALQGFTRKATGTRPTLALLLSATLAAAPSVSATVPAVASLSATLAAAPSVSATLPAAPSLSATLPAVASVSATVPAVASSVSAPVPAGFPAGSLPHVLPPSTAERFGRLNMLYGDRICPVETYALDFTKKLTGQRYYKADDGTRYTPCQLLTAFIFWGDEWSRQPVIRMKGGALKQTLQLPDRCSVSTFFNPHMGGYILGPYLHEYYQGRQDAFHKDVAKTDDRLQLVMELRQGRPLKLFPVSTQQPPQQSPSPLSTPENGQTVTWYAPTDRLPAVTDTAQAIYVRDIFTVLNQCVQASDWATTDELLDKMLRYQQRYGAASLPSATRLQAEHLYNKVPFATWLFMLCLTMGLLCALSDMVRHHGKTQKKRQLRVPPVLVFYVSASILLLAFLALSLCLALRWAISGSVPMSNGYETMLFMAWLLQLLTLVLCRRFPIMLTFGFLLSGFFLLVSHISQMDPQISHLMPVLQSPLLTLHVSIIMMAYALLSLTFICALTAVVNRREAERLAALSQLFLYPALACLGFGIFIGAIWANVSWGTYWSWDPKETWALITLMVYAIPVHQRTLKRLGRPFNYHLFMLMAFLTLLMTYFGVNYFLGGMHSYA